MVMKRPTFVYLFLFTSFIMEFKSLTILHATVSKQFSTSINVFKEILLIYFSFNETLRKVP